MNETHETCDPELISRFHDKELAPEEYIRVGNHLKTCPSCKKLFEDLETLSGHVQAHMADPVLKTEYARIEENVIRSIREKASWWIRAKEAFLSKRVLVPVSIMASLTLVFFTLFRPPATSGPSAIINSISGDLSSVIVMETPKTHQTIIWFHEKIHSERGDS